MPTALRSVIGLILGGFVGLVAPWVFVYAMAAVEGQPANLGGAQGGGLEVFACSMVCGLGGGAAVGALIGANSGSDPRQRERDDRTRL